MCEYCWAEWGIQLWTGYDTYETVCYKCVNALLAKNEWVIFRWKYYKKWHPDVRRCDYCEHWIVHNEFAASSHNRCLACALQKIRNDNYDSHPRVYCHKCGVIHRNWMCDWSLSDTVGQDGGSISFVVRRDSKSRDPKGWYKPHSDYVKSIWQFQTERTLEEDTQEMLKQFYHNTEKFSHYYTREPITITGEVSYRNTAAVSKVRNMLFGLRDYRYEDITKGKRVSKYSNMYLQWIDDTWLVKWKYIDVMWNIRERSESINKFLQDQKQDVTNENMTNHFKYVLSSNIEHKIMAFKLNEKVGSCQKSHNYSSYARWAYDAITNGCNCPILLYAIGSNEPFARITTRIMYDKTGQEYILIDRLYHSWEFSDSLMKWTIYKWIVQDLKAKWYKVIASNYSAHDESTYAYLASLGMRSNTIVEDLCQPLRRLIWGYWYYSDGGIVVYAWQIDWLQRATDYLDKAYVL